MSAQEILVVGSVAFDDIETPAGKRVDCWGGSATYFSASASLFAPVRLVAVVGDDFPTEATDALAARGVDLSGLERVPGRTFRWRGRYANELADAETLETQLNCFEHFEPKIPAEWRNSKIVMLGNIHPTLQGQVLDQIEAPELVVADTMNFWITGEREELLKVLKRIDLLVINETEARLLSGEKNVYKAAAAVLAMGPKMLILKQGGYGALMFHPDGMFVVPAVPLTDVIDPTGAGDTFAAGFVGAVAEAGNYEFATLRRAALTGTVMASFACEGFSLDRVLTLTREELSTRVAALRRLIQVD